MALAISVPYTIMEDSGVIELNPIDGAQAKVKFKCLWTDHYQLVRDLMWGIQPATKPANQLANGSVSSLTLVSGGSGYSGTLTVNFSGGGGSGATASATLSGSAVGSVTLGSGGSGYTNAPAVRVTGSTGGSNAVVTATLSNSISSVPITRIQPLPYPPVPTLLCRSIESVEPLGAPIVLSNISSQWLVKQYAVITAVFAYIPWLNANDASGQPYTQTSISCTGEMMTIPGSNVSVGGNPIQVPLGIVVPQMEITFKRFFMPYIPLAEIASISGTVNGVAFPAGDCIFPVDTLLFIGGNTDIASDTQGNITQTVEYKFAFRNNPTWNQLMLSPGAVSTPDVLPYTRADFSILP